MRGNALRRILLITVMGRAGLVAMVMVLASGTALATEPALPASAALSTYAPIALTEQKPPSAAQPQFDMPRLPAHPLRASLLSTAVKPVGAGDVAPRMIRVALETESVASFPIDDEVPPNVVALPPARPPALRRNLDDDGDVFERAGATRRSIRQSLEESSELAPVSAARRLRSSLD